jgi:3-ketosteroid 9alpha-monooxygenase subunit B
MTAVPAMHRHHALRVEQVTRETKDAVSIVFDVPPELDQTFTYRPGQFVTLKLHIDDEDWFRSYSMSSSPGVDGALQVTVKRVPDGMVSNWLNDHVAAGTVLDVSPPAGTFVLADAPRDVVAFAAGSGITPVYSILKAALADGSIDIRLLYANRDRDATIFADELDALAAQHTARFRLVHHLDVDRGFVSCASVHELIGDDRGADAFICGPPPFMDTVQTALHAAGWPESRIHVERFTPVEETPAGPVADIEVVITIGRETKTVAHRGGATILQSARSAAMRPPASCESGTCATCMARVVEGAVDMRNNEALTDDEVRDGWVLTCQSVPTTRVVKVVYE